MAVCDASILIVSATWGVGVYGTCVGYNYRYERRMVTIRAEGSTNPDCQGTIEKSLTATVRYLEGAFKAESDTAASLVFVTTQSDGGTTTETLVNMIPVGAARRADRDSPPFEYEQDFICKGTCSIPTVA